MRRRYLMKHLQREQQYNLNCNLTNHILDNDSIFFDIETTGFSPVSSNIYLIGCLYKKNNHIVVEQFFAENEEDEVIVLDSFIKLIAPFKKLISFNGKGFDIPFIKAKCKSYHIKENLEHFTHYDIFKIVCELKFLLNLPNYKQKSIEHFLGIDREDFFTGGELIEVYQDYKKAPSPNSLDILLLHNYDDVTGMLKLLPILSYHYVLNGYYNIKSVQITSYTTYQGNEAKEIVISLENDFSVPKRISFQFMDYYYIMENYNTKIRIPVYEGELRYFYDDYKNYFFLPHEDMAVHKSVAIYVDKQYRLPAKANNCYTRKMGTFLPQHKSIITPSFKKEYNDKTSYFELTEDFYSSHDIISSYIKHIFSIRKCI